MAGPLHSAATTSCSKPAPQGRGRVPRFGHHGQPRRQGKNPRHPRTDASPPEARTQRVASPGGAARFSLLRLPQHSPPRIALPDSSRSVAAAAPARHLLRRRFPCRLSLRIRYPDAIRRLVFSHPTQRAADYKPCARPACSPLRKRRPQTPAFCWSECILWGTISMMLKSLALFDCGSLGHTPRFSGEPPVSA